MNLHLNKTTNQEIDSEITISGSKSESNRLLILQQLFPEITIDNLSDSDDTHHLQEALSSSNEIADIGHAGTAMRFLTAFFAAQPGVKKIVQGSHRMHNRPIKILVDALRSLGANIQYLEKEGYPPLKIIGAKIEKSNVEIEGSVSSQYISALMLIAPFLTNGLTIKLLGEITSVPYIKMTLQLLHQIGVTAAFKEQEICIQPISVINKQEIVVESDWSSVSYFYSILAMSPIGSSIKLSSYKENSLQGDSCLATIYKHFGVVTSFNENSILIEKAEKTSNKLVELDLKNAPDIAQTITVTCFGLGVSCNLTGLHTLKIKETDRLEALKIELSKLGADISITNNSLHLKSSEIINENIAINTYNDHRMAMAFAPLSLKVPIVILDSEVVTKSYRNFWNDVKKAGILFTETK